MVPDWCVGEVTVEGEITGDSLGDHPINQFLGQVGVIPERMIVVTLLALAERRKSAKVQLIKSVEKMFEEL